jgi:hypothetical protein
MVATKACALANAGGRNFFRPSSSSKPSDCAPNPKNSNCDFSSRACESSHLSSVPCGLLCAFCSDGRLFSISCGLFCQKQGGGVGVYTKIAGTRASGAFVQSAQPLGQVLISALTPPEIRCAAMEASGRNLCGRAKGWNSIPGCWPRPRGASSLQRMLLPPLRSAHWP